MKKRRKTLSRPKMFLPDALRLVRLPMSLADALASLGEQTEVLAHPPRQAAMNVGCLRAVRHAHALSPRGPVGVVDLARHPAQ
eukprot:12756293-Heterocapsa_arctica.AAC.1